MPKQRTQTTTFNGTSAASTTRHRETHSKPNSSSDNEDVIPIPIQIFLWRQSNPFIKQKFGNLTDASAISFDRVLVQNISHGLSPSLSDAIVSIPRWLLIKVAFPHVMHACSAAIEHSLHSIQQQPAAAVSHPAGLVSSSLSLSPSSSSQLQVPTSAQLPLNTPNLPLTTNLQPSATLSPTGLTGEHSTNRPPLFRISSATHSSSSYSSLNNKLSATEIRLFHTLHYLILNGPNQSQTTILTNDQLLPLNTIQLFIYLFIPYIHTYLQTNEREFLSHSELTEGMRLLWQPLLEYRQPNIRMFNSFVKPMIPSYATFNENGDCTSSMHDSHQSQQQQTFYINNDKSKSLSVLVQSPTPIPTIATKAIIEEAEEDQHPVTSSGVQPSTSSSQPFIACSYSMQLPRSASEKQPLSDLTNQQTMPAPIVSSEGSSTSLFHQITTKKEQKSSSSIHADSDTTTNNSITDLSAYGTTNGTKPRAPLVHMSSICSISDSSRLTTSPQSPTGEKSVQLPGAGNASSSSSASTPSVLIPLHCSQCQQPVFAPNHPPGIPYICSSCTANRTTISPKQSFSTSDPITVPIKAASQKDSTPMTRRQSAAVTKPRPSPRSAEILLLATYFDIGILRTLFSPSWLTDGYLWCLEYLYKRIIDISDEVLSDALTNGTSPLNILRFKSLSIPQLNASTGQDYYEYLKNMYFNEQVTNDIIEQQCMMAGTGDVAASTSIKQPATLLNVPFKYFAGKSPYTGKHSQKYDNFYKKISKIRYIDEEGIEHLDLATTERRDHNGQTISLSRGSRLHLNDPNLFTIKSISDRSPLSSTQVITNSAMRQSVDSILNATNNTSNNNTIKQPTNSLSPAPITNLNSMKTYSVSDSEINYKFLEEIEEAQGSSAYINRSGTINFGVVLAGIHAVICKEHHLKVCELVMNILDVLLGLAVISSSEEDVHKRQFLSTGNNGTSNVDRADEQIEELLKQMDAKEEEKFQLAVDITLRIIKRLGCPNCQPRGRSFTADQLRGKVRLSLNKLRLLNQHRFEKYFLNLTLHGDLVHILDIFHALCGYCTETNGGLAHYAPYIPTKGDTNARQTYSNNFGNTHLGVGPKGIDGFILNIIFKPFVTRLIMMKEYLMSSENVALYGECRAFLTCIKENHGGIFRLVVFSSLLDPEKKLKALQQQELNLKAKGKGSHVFIRQDAIHNTNKELPLNRDLSDESEIDRHAVPNQPLSTSNADEQQTTNNISSASFTYKSRNTRARTGSLLGGDDHSLYTHQEESLYVDLTLVRLGLLRLNFLMESCPPGSLPDPQFLNSLLILDSPVISKAAYLVECAHFVRRCSLGQWPEWMRINMTTFRPHESFAARATGNINARLNKLYQAAAARMFYIWGEALSSQLETILDNEQKQLANDNPNETGGGGGGGGTTFWNSDETYEDYYNEAIVNRSGHDCPYSLRIMACLLLYEITSFLRETYDTLPKLSSMAASSMNYRQQRQRTNNQPPSVPQTFVETSSTLTDKRSSDRMRMGSVVSQTSNRSSASISSEHPALSPQTSSATIPPVLSTVPATVINMNPALPSERHISFAVNKENDSNESNHTALIMNEDEGVIQIDGNSSSGNADRRMSVATHKPGSVSGSSGKSKLIRRSSAKLRKPSLRMKDSTKLARRSSYRTRRRSHASNISSETDGHQSNIGSSAMEPTDEYLNGNDEDFDQSSFDDTINTRPFPWLKVVIRILNDVNLMCDHQIKCVSNCYDKQTTSCKNLIQALLNIYRLSSTQNLTNIGSSFSRSSSSTHRSTTHLKRNDTTSSKNQHDLKKRRLSTCLFGDSTSPNVDNLTKTANTNKTADVPPYGMFFETADPHFDKQINTHFTAVAAYLEKQVGTLTQVPLMILCKSSVLLEDEHYSQILKLSWELLLDRNEELAACAATIVILTAARAGHLIDALFHAEMENSSALIRYNAILKFQTLWRFRYQFWIRLEEGAHSMMKILPPSIEFVLPSPALGVANLQTVDPPWMPHAKTLVQQVALNQEEVRAVVTASKTRKKHQQELIHSALMAEETSKRVARENFSMSTVSMLQSASFEPLLHQPRDEEEEAHADDDRFGETSVQIRQAQGTFPSALGVAVFLLVQLLEDEETLDNGATVSEAARKALWSCLVDEPTLLIRFFFEKLSQKERRTKSLQSLRRLMICLTDIPSQFAHAVFNYVLGLLMSMVRSPLDGAQELIAAGLTLLWQIIPYLNGLVLKDLKQILRKEQAEMMILITGNIPSTKKVIIHGPDLSQIPTQAIIQEDTQFSNVLQEALDFFGIPDSKRDRYYLIDVKTQQIHIPDTYVRDFYFFRRNIYPQLSLVHMDIKQSHRQLENMSIYLKTTELSKVLFARYLLENTPYNQIHNCVTFFHDELIKSPSFPRKPLESDYNLYTRISDKELFNLDMLHKYNWIKLIACLFFNMDGKTTTTWDITLFLNVINGSFILHCEDYAMLRFCLATYISTAKHFRYIFATNGYLLIMPTILRVYSNIQSNPMLKKALEYCCRQFFILHRIPFILQMLGSVSELLDFDEQADVTDTNKIQPICLFRLLIALEQTSVDALRDEYSILELVKDDTSSNKSSVITPSTMPVANMTVVAALGQGNMIAPATIKTLDFCYADDETIFTVLNCIDVCVTVVAYAPDSIRSLQMLGIIDILLPKYLQYLKDRTNKNDSQKQGREEMKIIEKLSTAIKTMISASESLTRTFVGPKHDPLSGASYKHSRGSNRSPSIVPDEDSMSRFIDDRAKTKTQDGDEHKQASEFRWPRDTLLSVISTFVHFSTQRLKELIKLINDPTLRVPELLDAKSHARLADIAHTLLKLGGYDPITMSCRGIQNYFQKLLPCTNWSQEQLRPALNLLLRRIDRMFSKICKKAMTKRCFDWEATAGILNGIYLTIDRHPYIAYFPNLKALVSGCIALVLNENVSESSHSVPRFDTPAFPKEFSRAVIKLVGRYLLAIKNQPNLEALTGNSWSFPNVPSAINHLLHFLLPLMFWAGSGRKDAPKIHPADISYIITILLNAIKPTSKLPSAMGSQSGTAGGPSGPMSSGPAPGGGKQHLTIGEAILQNSSFTHKSMKQLKDLLQTASLLGLKVLIIGFGKQLKREWQRIAQSIKLMCNKQAHISPILLSFIEFIVSYKTPIFVILRPFLFHYMHSITSDSERDFEAMTNIQQKLIFDKITPSKSTGEVLHSLMQELNQLKAELTATLMTTSREISRTGSATGKRRILLSRAARRRKREYIPLMRLSSSDESKSLFPYETRPTGAEKVRFDTEALEQNKDRDIGAGMSSGASDERSGAGRATNTYRIRRQQSSDSSLNSSPRKKTERIRTKEALDILETYLARYRIRSGAEVSEIPIEWTRDLTLKRISATTDEPPTPILSDVSRPHTTANSNPPSHLSRSITAPTDRCSSVIDQPDGSNKITNEDDNDQSTSKHETAPRLSTFRGWKRDMTHLDKSRLSRGLIRAHVSSEPTMAYDATKEMNDIMRPNRQANEQEHTSVVNELASDFIDTQTSNDPGVLASLFNNSINEQTTPSTSIPMTTILPVPTETHTEVWISRLPNTSYVTEADYESQV